MGGSCLGIAQLIAIAVVKCMFGRTDEWAYSIPYALQVCDLRRFTCFVVDCLLVGQVSCLHYQHLSRVRVPLVEKSQGAIRRYKTILTQSDFAKKGSQFQCRRDCWYDAAKREPYTKEKVILELHDVVAIEKV